MQCSWCDIVAIIMVSMQYLLKLLLLSNIEITLDLRFFGLNGAETCPVVKKSGYHKCIYVIK